MNEAQEVEEKDCSISDTCLLSSGHDGDCITTETIGLFRKENRAKDRAPVFTAAAGPVMLEVAMDAVVTKEARDIVTRHAPETLELFLEKNARNQRTPLDLRERGLYPDIHRKMSVLQDRIWDDREDEFEGEPTTEVIQDLIGHLLLMLQMISSK